jgi:hypothetical protein
MTKLQLLMLSVGVLLAAAPMSAQRSAPKQKKQIVQKADVCHHTKGKHPGAKTLRVRQDEVSSHLAHGDTQGGCPIR